MISFLFQVGLGGGKLAEQFEIVSSHLADSLGFYDGSESKLSKYMFTLLFKENIFLTNMNSKLEQKSNENRKKY